MRAELEQLRAENAALRAQNDELALADARFQALLESQSIGVFIGNIGGEVIAMNRSFQHIIGRSHAQLGKFGWRDCVLPEELARHEENADLLWKTGWCPAWETSLLRPDGACARCHRRDFNQRRAFRPEL